jgi:hypothetical protein
MPAASTTQRGLTQALGLCGRLSQLAYSSSLSLAARRRNLHPAKLPTQSDLAAQTFPSHRWRPLGLSTLQETPRPHRCPSPMATKTGYGSKLSIARGTGSSLTSNFGLLAANRSLGAMLLFVANALSGCSAPAWHRPNNSFKPTPLRSGTRHGRKSLPCLAPPLRSAA